MNIKTQYRLQWRKSDKKMWYNVKLIYGNEENAIGEFDTFRDNELYTGQQARLMRLCAGKQQLLREITL